MLRCKTKKLLTLAAITLTPLLMGHSCAVDDLYGAFGYPFSDYYYEDIFFGPGYYDTYYYDEYYYGDYYYDDYYYDSYYDAGIDWWW